jgi:Golgi phosphoprotein 3 (GPP34)
VVSRHGLAIDLFLIAHDPFDDGRLRISPELLGCGLVGAELTDLMLDRRLGVDGDELVVLDADGPPDEIDDYVIEAVASQSKRHPVRAWVEPLQDGLYALVGREVVASGAVRHRPGGRRLAGGRQPDRFPAEDLLVACRPQQNLEERLRAPRDLTLAAGTLAALIGVLGIDRLLDQEFDRVPLRELLTEIEHNLPGDLRAVCDGIRAVIAGVSLRAR